MEHFSTGGISRQLKSSRPPAVTHCVQPEQVAKVEWTVHLWARTWKQPASPPSGSPRNSSTEDRCSVVTEIVGVLRNQSTCKS